MSQVVVADAGPLIGLARAQRLALLHTLYGHVSIPPAVQEELQLGSRRPGAVQLQAAVTAGWLKCIALQTPGDLRRLAELLDPGEAEAIRLAEELPYRFLLIDNLKGRAVAKRRGIPVVGVAGVLLAAKTRGLIPAVLPIMAELSQAGYRLASSLVAQVATLAQEND
jgi:predicted nucleic acid-binding protein